MRIRGLSFEVAASAGARHLVWGEPYRLLGIVAVPAGTVLCQQPEGPLTSWGGTPDCPWCLKEALKLDPSFEPGAPPLPDQLRLF